MAYHQLLFAPIPDFTSISVSASPSAITNAPKLRSIMAVLDTPPYVLEVISLDGTQICQLQIISPKTPCYYPI